MASTSVAIAGVVGTFATALAGIVASFWAERKRAADANRYRNHEQRAKAAMDYLFAVDAFRHDVADQKWQEANQSGRTLEDVLGRTELFFDNDVVDQARRAQKKIVEAIHHPDCRDSLLEDAKKERDSAKTAMRRPLESSAKKA